MTYGLYGGSSGGGGGGGGIGGVGEVGAVHFQGHHCCDIRFPLILHRSGQCLQAHHHHHHQGHPWPAWPLPPCPKEDASPIPKLTGSLTKSNTKISVPYFFTKMFDVCKLLCTLQQPGGWLWDPRVFVRFASWSVSNPSPPRFSSPTKVAQGKWCVTFVNHGPHKIYQNIIGTSPPKITMKNHIQ